MKKIIFLASLIALVGAGCAKESAQEQNTQETSGEQSTQMQVPAPGNLDVEEMIVLPPSENDERVTQEPAPQTRTIEITAKQFEFIPAEIYVKQGEEVKLKITSVDVAHGFSIPQFNLNSQLFPNQTTEITFTPDKAGRFTFFCSVYCGVGHNEMKGTLVVE